MLEGLRDALKIPICVDTRKSQVAEAAIAAGAQIINDVSGLRSDPRIAEVYRSLGVIAVELARVEGKADRAALDRIEALLTDGTSSPRK